MYAQADLFWRINTSYKHILNQTKDCMGYACPEESTFLVTKCNYPLNINSVEKRTFFS